MSQNPRVNIAYPPPCVSQSVWLFLVLFPTVRNILLFWEAQHWASTLHCPLPPSNHEPGLSQNDPTKSHERTSSLSRSEAAFQWLPLALVLYNMRNKVITTAEGNRSVWMKWAGRQKPSVCKGICFCQVGAEVRPERCWWSVRVFFMWYHQSNTMSRN